MQRIAEFVERQGLHVIFEIGRGAAPGRVCTKAPSWLGDMVNGPLRNSRKYSSPMPIRPNRLLARLVQRARYCLTLNAMRICR